ncbi:hypothetical protein N7492_009464 [Penicillium capsulatum]|uniref:Autophagy-related protein Atg28 n=1 Tax=Penicillium capsulatum TaxID=69766 RepID=A0A9W9HSJ7_9EURO|nr:hypothetical protein N7492_009464 [Penicillium capsulatum]KAJ6106854.1 hypothetical protein N7512_010371 [Penicillium capsulatum]
MSTLLSFRDKRLPPVPASASMYHHDPLLRIERQTRSIQQNLQSLIDAQSEALSFGLSQSRAGEASDGSFTPTSSAAGRSQSPSTLPTQQPRVKRTGLQDARRGIFRSIHDLLKLREEEREILESQADERDHALQEIDGFDSRRNGLEEAISIIRNDRDNQRSKRLQEEAHGLETDIHELETRLFEMKARHKYIVRELSNIGNSVDAKLSSYNESLTLLQSDVRRTLDMAREHWRQEQEDLRNKQQAVVAEILALEEGGGVWKEVMADISGFEKRLGVYMRRYIQLDTQERSGTQVHGAKAQLATSVTGDLEQTTQRLKDQLEHSEGKEWKLLVCCIAAELEALREARGMLLPAFGVSASDTEAEASPSQEKEAPESPRDIRAEALENDDPEPPADLLKDGDVHHTDSASRSEDDEPDPAWLLPGS